MARRQRGAGAGETMHDDNGKYFCPVAPYPPVLHPFGSSSSGSSSLVKYRA
jgi:hypothetical protein